MEVHFYSSIQQLEEEMARLEDQGHSPALEKSCWDFYSGPQKKLRIIFVWEDSTAIINE